MISADGRLVAFESESENLSTEDDDLVTGVFVRDLTPLPEPPRAVPPTGEPARPGAAARCGEQEATLVGTPGRDVLRGTPGRDVIAALGGADLVIGGGGADLICLGAGADRSLGGPGNDRITGGPGPTG